MVNLRRIFKDYRDSGAFHALVGVQAAIGDGVSGVNYFFGLTTIISPYQRQLFFDS